jgi:hypothetical protein
LHSATLVSPLHAARDSLVAVAVALLLVDIVFDMFDAARLAFYGDYLI